MAFPDVGLLQQPKDLKGQKGVRLQIGCLTKAKDKVVKRVIEQP
jgi:hypothetical protein